MKKLVLLFAVCLLFTFKGYSQFAFGVAPGLSTNSAYFGLKAGKVVPYIGFQMANVGVTTIEDGEEYDYDEGAVIPYSDEIKFSGNLYVPEIGVKFFAIEKNKLKGYFNLNVAKPFIGAKMKDNGEEIEEVSDMVKKVKLIGGEFGFGVEYFFDNNFSVGGEFGFRYMHGKFSETHEEDVWNPSISDYETVEIENTVKAHFMPTYSKISLNFYFGGE